MLAAAAIIEKRCNLPLWQMLLIYLIPYLVVGLDTLKEAAESLAHGEALDENFLMSIATIGALAIGFLPGAEPQFAEAVFVMLFFQIGELFEGIAEGRSRHSIAHLMDIRPDTANLEKDGALVVVAPQEVAVGDVIVVKPGEKVPIDAVVTSGTSSLNTAALTGESLPRDVKEGDTVLSGSINLTGVLTLRTTAEFGESTVSKILELVEDSASHKSRSEDFITRFARVYTPAVVGAALALALLPPLVRLLLPGLDPMWNEWIYRALTFLVISCPCALVISIPLSFFAGIGGASREGILVKGANILENLSKVRTVVMDKTGTLTLGVFEVSAMHDIHDHVETDENEKRLITELAAIAECASSHPISKTLRKAYGQEIDHKRISDIQELAGLGITALIDGRKVAVGNEKLMESLGLEYCHCGTAGTIVHVAVDGHYAGHIVLGDVLKPHAEEVVGALKACGVQRTVMLTGDSRDVADQMAGVLGVDEVYAELLPADKVARVEEMLSAKSEGDRIAFVGDGINDAPVLSRADIGIAMGGAGSDAAIEAADIVLMDDSPLKIATAIRISRKTLRIVRENIVMALGIKGVCLILGALGIANMWLAIFADVGVMILAVLNAIRAMAKS